MDLKKKCHAMKSASTSVLALGIQDTMKYGKEIRTMADVKWIKMATGLPDNKKLKQIRKLPDGDTIALMWVFLLCLAGDVNENGLIYITPEVPYTDEMLAEEFRMDVNTIRLGLATFQKFEMLEIVDDVICLSAWEKWQNTDKLSELREYNRLAKQKSRAKQKLLASNNVNDIVNDKSMTSQPSQDTDIEKDKEEEKELYISIVEYLNQKAGTHYKHSTQKTRTCIHARLKEGFTLDDFKTVIDKKVSEWKGTEMEQYLRPETLFGTKFEGYLNAKINKEKPKNSFNNFTPRNYDAGKIQDMERLLLQNSMNI